MPQFPFSATEPNYKAQNPKPTTLLKQGIHGRCFPMTFGKFLNRAIHRTLVKLHPRSFSVNFAKLLLSF